MTEDNKDTIKTLKAEAYDLLALSERVSVRLREINQQIAQLSQPQPEVKKDEVKQ